MASQGDGEPRTSRLQQIQMRFQQKTLQEKEQRRTDLNTPKSNGSAVTAATHPGKVRQMFDERRRGAGIDRSNPLKPIPSVVTSPKHSEEHKLIKGVTAMSLKESAAPVTVKRRQASDINMNNTKYSAYGATNRLKPVVTRKTPPVQEKEIQKSYAAAPPKSPKPMPVPKATMKPSNGRQAEPVRQVQPVQRVQQVQKVQPVPKVQAVQKVQTVQSVQPVQPVQSVQSVQPIVLPQPQVKKPVKKAQPEPKSPVTKMNPQPDQPAPEGTESCRFCGRHFLTERLAKHEAVCQRTMKTKRKIFDAVKQRNLGTENERYIKKSKTGRSQSTYSSAAQQQGLSTGVKKSNWRKKHEDFVQSIRAAKQLKAHLARGGKVSDLPPPPPSENPDYIKCPHCGRRFNQQAAERHIPKCATMVHNKPRRDGPPPLKKR